MQQSHKQQQRQWARGRKLWPRKQSPALLQVCHALLWYIRMHLCKLKIKHGSGPCCLHAVSWRPYQVHDRSAAWIRACPTSLEWNAGEVANGSAGVFSQGSQSSSQPSQSQQTGSVAPAENGQPPPAKRQKSINAPNGTAAAKPPVSQAVIVPKTGDSVRCGLRIGGALKVAFAHECAQLKGRSCSSPRCTSRTPCLPALSPQCLFSLFNLVKG